ncbi:MAG: hypothetical protein AAGL89_00025 [Pseudomonadota bacterium]
MYSARTINQHLGNDPASKKLTVFEKLPATESTLPGLGGILTNRDGDFEVSGRESWIFISIKNRGFTRPYIDRFIDMCERLQITGHICPVDDPYRYNAMAELKMDDLPQTEIEKIDRLSQDIQRMAQKAINGKLSKRVNICQWRDLEAETPAKYRKELTRAFEQEGQVYRALRSHVMSVKPVDTDADLRRYAEFFLCEVPVLMHSYYCRGATLDIYPGRQPDFFWQIELGAFEDELPELTKMTRRGRAMLYLDTHDRSHVARELRT